MEPEIFPKLVIVLKKLNTFHNLFFSQPVWYQILLPVSIILRRKDGSIYRTLLILTEKSIINKLMLVIYFIILQHYTQNVSLQKNNLMFITMPIYLLFEIMPRGKSQ